MRVYGVAYEGIKMNAGGAREAPYFIIDRLRSVEKTSLLFEKEIELEIQGVVEIDGHGKEAIKEIRALREKGAFIGGDHTITMGLVPEDVKLVVLDAHLDARDVFLGERYTHASVVRRVYEEATQDIIVMGVRATSREELSWARGKVKVVPYRLKPIYTDKPVYLSVDVDVFDPAFAPATGTPEPGGISYRMFLKWLRDSQFTLVGFDVVEVYPFRDTNMRTSTLVATLVRDVGARFWGKRYA